MVNLDDLDGLDDERGALSSVAAVFIVVFIALFWFHKPNNTERK